MFGQYGYYMYHLGRLYGNLKVLWFLSGMTAPVVAQPQFIVPAPSQYMQGSGSDQTAGWGVDWG